MAKVSNIYTILVALSMAMTSTTRATTTAPEKEESLIQCARHMGYYCGNQMLDALESHANVKITEACCYKVVQTGYSCHTRLALFALQNDPEFRHQNVSHVLEKNDRIFHTCDEATQPESDKYLAKCVVKIGTDCGVQVFDKLLHDGKGDGITDCCCRKLLDMGLACHVNMVKNLIRTPKMRDVDAVAFLKKSKDVFDQCRRAE